MSYIIFWYQSQVFGMKIFRCPDIPNNNTSLPEVVEVSDIGQNENN